MKCLSFLLFVVFSIPLLAGDQLETAIAFFEHGDFTSAESILRLLLKSNAADPAALGLLGAVLDGEKKYQEAEDAYRLAIKLNPRSATLLNNYANHQLETGNKAAARATYLRVIAVDPTRDNANLQLAEFAVENKDGLAALRYLQHLATAVAGEAQVQILELKACYLAKRITEGAAIQSRLALSLDPRLNFSVGLALASVARYGDAEQFFSRALESEPTNYDVLYNLGLAAFHASHFERARVALSNALQQKPADVDVLFNLSAVYTQLHQQAAALRLLSEASRVEPKRANVQLALAQTASALGYYADSRLAYESYLKLNPQDTDAQREHLFTVALSEQPRDGLQALKKFAQAHTNDPAAHYEVGVLEAKSDPVDAAEQFEKALSLQPNYTPARLGRGTLNLLQGKPSAALPDLQACAAQYPDNAAVLDRLGETLSALNRSSEAVAALSRASARAPRDSRILMHLSRAQAKAGDLNGARITLASFRALGPQPGNLIPQAGVVEFLALPVEQQEDVYREKVIRRVQEHPDDPDLVKRYLEVLLSEGKLSELSPVAQRLLQSRPPVPIAAEAGETLIRGKQYSAARSLLEYAATENPVDTKLQLNLAVVDLHTMGSAAGLARLDKIAESSQTGDFFLTQGILLDAAGQHTKAAAAFYRAAKLKPVTALLYDEAVQSLLKTGNQEEAGKVLKLAETCIPNDPVIDLLRASLSF